MKFEDLQLREPQTPAACEIIVGEGTKVEVRAYLSIDEKAKLISWVISRSLDERTATISPVRFETYFALAVVQNYADIEYNAENENDYGKIYDLLETNHIIDQVISAIPADEFEFLKSLAIDTAEDVERYSMSFLGMVNVMSSNAIELDKQLQNVLSKIKNAEGLEQLSVIKDVVGNS